MTKLVGGIDVTEKLHTFVVNYSEIMHKIKFYLLASFYTHINRHRIDRIVKNNCK